MPLPDRFARWALFAYVVLAVGLTYRMWADPAGRSLAGNPTDEALFEWFLARSAHALTQLDFSLVTQLMNAPKGLNLMANTSVILPGLVVSPVTLLFGAETSFVLLLTLGPAATAWTTFLLLRRLVRDPASAAVGGLVFGFCPAMVAQSQGHLHMSMAFLVPLIFLQVYDLVATTRPLVPIALRLAALAILQVFIGEEWLFIAAVMSVLMLIWLGVCRPHHVPRVASRVLHGGSLAVGIVLVVAGYPLWVQFYGPQSVSGSPFSYGFFSTDLQSYLLPSSLQRFGSSADKATSLTLRGGITEQNAAMGWPFLVVLAVSAWVLRASLLARAAAGAGITMMVLSLGPSLVVNNKETGLALPWRYVAKLPVFDAALPIRFPFAVYLAAAVLVALVLDRVTSFRPAVSVAPLALILMSLFLLLPLPFATIDVAPVPTYFTSAGVRAADVGGTVLVVPFPTAKNIDPMRWQVASGMRFAMPGGFYIGPSADGRALLSPDSRGTQDILQRIHEGQPYPGLDAGIKAGAATDLAYWGVTRVILGPSPKQPELLAFLIGILGSEPREIGGVLVWDLRS